MRQIVSVGELVWNYGAATIVKACGRLLVKWMKCEHSHTGLLVVGYRCWARD